MSRRPQGAVRPVRGGWLADVQFNTRRQRRWFKEKPDADTWLASALEAIRSHLMPMTPGEMATVREIAGLLPPDTTLHDAVRFFRAHHRSASSEQPLSEVYREYVEDKTAAGLRAATLRNIRHYVGRFVEAHARAPVNSMTTTTLLEYLRLVRASPTHRDDYRRAWSTFFAWCIRRQKIAHNPAHGMTAMRQQERTVSIYTPAQARALLEAAGKHRPKVVPYLAMGFFAGLRSSELLPLNWHDVDLRGRVVRVLPETAKTRRQRLVTIRPNLAAWLKPYRCAQGPVVPLGLKAVHRHLNVVHRKAGVPKILNGLRHSYGTYTYADWKDIARTAAEMGHATGVDVLLRHYRALASEADARAYFAIRPKKIF